MAISQILPFAVSIGSNVIDQTTYAASATLSTGFQTGVALSSYMNKAIRQSSLVAAGVAGFIASVGNVDCLDDGSVANQTAGLNTAVTAASRLATAWSPTYAYTAGQIAVYGGYLYLATAASTNSTPPSANWLPIGAGQTTVTTAGGTTTLTALQSQYEILIISGTLTANATIIEPVGVQRDFYVYNGTTGAFTVTVQPPTGTGVTIPQGFGARLYINGTDVYQQTPFVGLIPGARGALYLPTSGSVTVPTIAVGSASTGFYGPAANTLGEVTNGVERRRVDPSGNVTSFVPGASGLYPDFGVRAWVTFAGGSGAISGSGNVSSVTRFAAGSYTVNFTTAMPDTAYAASGLSYTGNGGTFINGDDDSVTGGVSGVAGLHSTTACHVFSFAAGQGLEDANFTSVMFVR